MSSTVDTFLLVEDNDIDAEKIHRGFRRLGADKRIVRARDGIEALEIMRGSKGLEALSPPYVILLDLNMPRMNGHEFLAELGADTRLRHTPVVVLTTSDRKQDIAEAYSARVSAYLIKPESVDEASKMLSVLCALWSLAEFPIQEAG